MSHQQLVSLKDLSDFTIVSGNKQAKYFKELFPDELSSIYKIVEDLKVNPKVVFFHSPDFDDYINILIHGNHDYLFEMTPNQFTLYKYKVDHLCESKSDKKILKNLVPAIIAILFTEWKFSDEEDNEYKGYIINTFKSFLENLKTKNVTRISGGDLESLEELPIQINNNQTDFIRVDILPHQLPQFKLRKKRKSDSKTQRIDLVDVLEESIKRNNFLFDDIKIFLSAEENSWVEKSFYLKKKTLLLSSSNNGNEKGLEVYMSQLDKEFDEILEELELIDGYGDENEQKLRELVDSIIDDRLSCRSSNKLIIGPQGTGKSSFSKLLGRLMDARVITIECGPLTDNSDLFGSYEIIIDPETRQAVTVYNENGFMYASKLVNEGHKVVLAVEEYNLLPSETLLKQLNRFFQDRIISSMGGRYEIGLEHKDNIIVIMTGNHDFNQDWLNDVGLIRRFEFFEFPLPSTESVVDCLYKYVNNEDFNIRITYNCAERIAEIRDDLVSSINEKTLRPILSKETKYPDIYTLRNFSLDLIHDVPVNIAVRRWLVKIILGGIPNDLELREEYLNYARIIQTTVDDRLPEVFVERINQEE